MNEAMQTKENQIERGQNVEVTVRVAKGTQTHTNKSDVKIRIIKNQETSDMDFNNLLQCFNWKDLHPIFALDTSLGKI